MAGVPPRSDLDDTAVDLGASQSSRGPDTAAQRPETAPTLRQSRRGPFGAWEREAPSAVAALADLAPSDVAERYVQKRLLGEGGMGEVKLCTDGLVGRDVAMKVIRAESGLQTDARARFLREARVQGQLEHPSVVPVYDIGTTKTGELYFTMKRIAGVTLEEVVQGLREADPRFVAEYPLRRLLGALGQVCLTLEFAHTRGVIHRDLKPANIMLGDFGEVYVLDWGIARVGQGDDGSMAVASESLDDEPTVADTHVGSLIGTPGYMSPEQARGEGATVDARADIYGLGAILFELLTWEPLHSGHTVLELLTHTIQRPDGRPKSKKPSVPPELDDICATATAASPADRFATARAMHNAIERFLDGERDLERRRTLAQEHVEEAVSRISQTRGDSPEANRTRAAALRSLGTALALDPEQTRAQEAVLSLLSDESGFSVDTEQEVVEVNLRDRTKMAGTATLAFASWLLTAPFVIWMGIRKWDVLLVLVGVLLGVMALLSWIWRTGNAHLRYIVIWSLGAFLAVSLLSVLFGPLMLVPQVAVATGASMIVGLRAGPAMRRWVTALALAATLVPLALSWLGLVSPAYDFRPDGLLIRNNAVGFSAVPTYFLLVISTISGVVVSNRLHGQGVEAERKSVARAHRLRQMFPGLRGPLSPG